MQAPIVMNMPPHNIAILAPCAVGRACRELAFTNPKGQPPPKTQTEF
jgi:hypothetical protein